jgi:uncharacterized protein (DUF4415 family)
LIVPRCRRSSDWSGAEVGKFYWPPEKPVTMRLDADVVERFKSYESGYQTKANMLLCHAMQSTQQQSQAGNDGGRTGSPYFEG